jgi:type II secretory pathway pseudopilin PulG
MNQEIASHSFLILAEYSHKLCSGGQSMNSRRRAFTLVELLVVIGIIIALVGLILPVFARAREEGKRIQCLSNLRQLTTAWLAYGADNAGYMCSSQPPPITSPIPARTTSWIGAVSDPNRLEHGVLWSYINNEATYRCPDDAVARASSYQINGLLAGTVGNPYPLARLGDISQSDKTFVFIEGCALNGILVNCFQTEIYPKNAFHVGGWPGQNHSSDGNAKAGTGISFADGHAIFWTYVDPRTSTLLTATASGINNTVITINGTETTKADDILPNSPDLYQLEAWSGGPVPTGVSQ